LFYNCRSRTTFSQTIYCDHNRTMIHSTKFPTNYLSFIKRFFLVVLLFLAHLDFHSLVELDKSLFEGFQLGKKTRQSTAQLRFARFLHLRWLCSLLNTPQHRVTNHFMRAWIVQWPPGMEGNVRFIAIEITGNTESVAVPGLSSHTQIW
jgi:hypothetical protein